MMADHTRIKLALCVVIILIILLLRKRRSLRRYWVRPLLQLRPTHGIFHSQYEFLKQHEQETFFQYTRLTVEQFDVILELVGPSLEKHSIRQPLSPEFRLFFTLRWVN